MKYDPKTAFGNTRLIAELQKTGKRKIGNLCPECKGGGLVRDEKDKIIGPCAHCKGRGIV